MFDYYFTFRSVTAATQGSRVLERGGVSAVMLRTPKELRQQGCGYSLRVRSNTPARARKLLAQEGVRYQRIYRRNGEQWQEVTL